ncbi:hypothetical protein [Butyricicoccus pullicaecorum]|uniref:hypothetical protein n=1 Tax=Butyricicoccus pullicaecorum TaxID=501571 RepID=UPI00194F2716|nr:hypothetical protein [Butyricicoccus pullicaecorum]
MKPGVRPGFQPKQAKKGKTTPMGGLSHERTLCAKSISLAAASDYFFILVDFRKAKIKRGFRHLWMAT